MPSPDAAWPIGPGFTLSGSREPGRFGRILCAAALLGAISNAVLVIFEKAVLKRWM
ncbi:MAG TPA: hypothetical protein H9800_02695 [Candidatus Microbacterium stercoravium]|uniref:Uncharacterized protein n=1 Tax=Candidatus Microbacterium stercoravium TaxID=2838697 RepID=A0A9D2KHF3_9MICO|nr:hypothetical protein [Candidatus Microbacterium stercoravium]